MKICALVKKGYHKDEPKKYRALVLKGKWWCASCGRTAVEAELLCEPKGKGKKKKGDPRPA